MEFLPKLASLAVGIGLAVGILYNVGFFLALDLRLFALLTYRDHLATLVIFTPIAVLPILWSIRLRADPTRRRQLTLAAGALAALTLAFALVEIVGGHALGAAGMVAAGLAALLLVVYCAAVLLDRGLAINETPAEAAARSEAARAMSLGVLGLIVFVTLLGASQASYAVRDPSFDTELTLTTEGSAPSLPRATHVVRVIDKGLLVVFGDRPGRIAFVRAEMVRLLSAPAKS